MKQNKEKNGDVAHFFQQNTAEDKPKAGEFAIGRAM